MAQSALIAPFLAGLVGGMHCFAMCGGYIAVVTSPPATTPMHPVVAGFGIAGLARARFAADALAHGPFCLVP